MGQLECVSRLSASAEEVWAHASSPKGIREELWPLVSMTFPRDVQRLTPATVTLGERLFRSWILLFGIIPVDYDDLVLVELEPGRRFLERSTMATQRVWEHERRVTPLAGGAGCEVSDRVRFEPRLGFLEEAHGVFFRLAFRHRHARLRRKFGVISGTTDAQ